MNWLIRTPDYNFARGCSFFRACYRIVIKTAICLLAAALVAAAHHSLDAEFNRRAETEYHGTVVSFNWENPHASFQASVAQAGDTVIWRFDLPSPSGLVRYGWAPDSLRGGDSISAYPAIDGSARASREAGRRADSCLRPPLCLSGFPLGGFIFRAERPGSESLTKLSALRFESVLGIRSRQRPHPA